MVAEKQRPGCQRERLAPEQFRLAGRRVLDERASTFDQEAGAFSMDELRLALGAIRLALKTLTFHLPEPAFDEQPPDADGNEVWTAGQIINHLGASQIGMAGWLSAALCVAFDPEDHPLINLTDSGNPGMLSREQALHMLDDAEPNLEALFDAMPPTLDPAICATHPLFGEVTIAGGVLATVVHEQSHLEQLLVLRAACSPTTTKGHAR